MKKLDDSKPVLSDGIRQQELLAEIRVVKSTINSIIDKLTKFEVQLNSRPRNK